MHEPYEPAEKLGNLLTLGRPNRDKAGEWRWHLKSTGNRRGLSQQPAGAYPLV